MISMFKSEEHFLDIINEVFPNTHPHMLVGRGDDCAVLACPSKMCVSSDLFLEDVHFRLRYFSPEDVGYKALAVNLSDLAAHGAKPLGFNLNLIWPSYLDVGFCRSMLEGMAELAGQFDLALTGGDLSFGSSLGLGVTIWGQSPEKILLRGKCLPGEILFLVGQVGLARCGLSILEKDFLGTHKYPRATSSHLRPVPLVPAGQFLARHEVVKGLMDVSDGLVRDLSRFLAPGTGVEISRPFSVHQEVVRYCASIRTDPVIFSLLGGEDYSLLGGCAQDDWPVIQSGLSSAWKLGRVISGQGIFLDGQRLNLKGFDHFEK
jgi:thiamine-monophosphate kinase